jgi:hypothetical protein
MLGSTSETNTQVSHQSQIAVGVVDATVDVRFAATGGDRPGGWVFFNNSFVSHNGKLRLFGRTFAAGDRIGCLVDVDNHAVAFFKNRVPLGVPFTDVVGPVFAFVGLGRGCRVQTLYPEGEIRQPTTPGRK